MGQGVADVMMLYVMAAIVGLFCGGMLLVRCLMEVCGFYREWRYVSDEIERVEDGERAYWLARRRRLWLSLLPFVAYQV